MTQRPSQTRKGRGPDRPLITRELERLREKPPRAGPTVPLSQLDRRRLQVRQDFPDVGYHLGNVGGASTHFGAQLVWFVLPHVGPDGLHPGAIGRHALFLVAAYIDEHVAGKNLRSNLPKSFDLVSPFGSREGGFRCCKRPDEFITRNLEEKIITKF